MVTTRFVVPGISCDHCRESIEGAVSPAGGVQRVEVDIPAKTVTVDHNPEVADATRLAGLIEDQGYDVESVEEVA